MRAEFLDISRRHGRIKDVSASWAVITGSQQELQKALKANMTANSAFASLTAEELKALTEWFESTFDFIKLHYYLSRREDTDFWIDNRNPETISDRLSHQLEMWRTRPTNQTDLGQGRPTFGHASYHQILFGLDFIPDLTGEDFIYPFKKLADFRSSQIANRVSQELQSLPSHRDLINSIYASA
ncbi:tryptophan 7-halogenase [candidate division KSB1 bacterium]|nr:tryptophan 7-halogenase [candidate division KSB1 bacterium]